MSARTAPGPGDQGLSPEAGGSRASLVLSGLSKSYGSLRALDGVDLRIDGGEVHALMGENGAGKSTLIRCLSGLETIDQGRIAQGGRTLWLTGPQAAEAAGLRVLHQELTVLPALSVAENMHLGLRYPTRAGLIDWRALAERSAAALARLGLRHIDPRRTMADLGPGDRMLVRIAATLVPRGGPAPWLYVFDEPTAALTDTETARLFIVLAELTGQGAGVLYVSHRMAEVFRIADRISVLRDGRLVDSRASRDTDPMAVIRAMTGRDLSALYPPRRPPAEGAAPVLRVEGLQVAGLPAGPGDGVTFDLAPGEVLGLAGLAGSGRGAILSALIGARPAQAGTVTLAGRRLGPKGGPVARWRAGIAYVPRERRSEGLAMAQSVTDNIVLPHLGRLGRLFGLRARGREGAMVARMADQVRLKAESPDHAVRTLSGGNQQKTVFARALAGSPRVLLLDEPTRGVDVGARYDIYRLIRAFCDGGGAVVLSSSDLTEIAGLSDRIAVLHRGRIVRTLPADRMTEATVLAELQAAATTALPQGTVAPVQTLSETLR